MRPGKGVEETVVGVMDDGVLWVFGELGLKSFEEGSAQSSFMIELVICRPSTEDLHTILRVAGDVFCIHGPDGLGEVVEGEGRALLHYDLGGTLDVLLLEVAGYFCL